MKTSLTLFFALALSFAGTSQVSNYSLDLNDLRAMLNDGGVFFNNDQVNYPGYEIPKGSALHTFYSMSFWYGGEDASGQLKLSAQTYTNLSDQFKGPLTNDGSAQPDLSGAWSNALFPVSQFDINMHLANYMNAGYVPAPQIANWPAHGDVANGFDFYLAPFVDTDGDGVYDPMAGDYPCIRGDQAVYLIMNDKGGVHASGGDPIGIEIHYMFYQYATVTDINRTTFVTGKVINRGTQTLNNFKVSMHLDGDIGNATDDFFGSDSTRNLLYFYNGDNFDEPSAISAGYAASPPAVGIISLTKDLESAGIFTVAPSVPLEYRNLMNAKDISGTPWMNPITMNPTNFMFPSDPASAAELNSEVGQASIPGDRRGLATLNFGTLIPSGQHTFDFAVIYNRDLIDNVDNASGLSDVADFVQNFFDTSGFVNDCVYSTIGLDELLSEVNFSIFPNPSDGEFTVSINTDFSKAFIEIRDVTGRIVLEEKELNAKETNVDLNESAGVYLLHLNVDGKETVKRIVFE